MGDLFRNLEWKLYINKLLGVKRRTAYVLIEKEGKFLLVQEGVGAIRNLWGLPGGGIKRDEEPSAAAIREAKEEAGYDVKIVKQIGNYFDKKRRTIRIVFKAQIVGGDGDYDKEEIIDNKWFTKDEIFNMKDKLRGDWVYRSIEDL